MLIYFDKIKKKHRINQKNPVKIKKNSKSHNDFSFNITEKIWKNKTFKTVQNNQ